MVRHSALFEQMQAATTSNHIHAVCSAADAILRAQEAAAKEGKGGGGGDGGGDAAEEAAIEAAERHRVLFLLHYQGIAKMVARLHELCVAHPHPSYDVQHEQARAAVASEALQTLVLCMTEAAAHGRAVTSPSCPLPYDLYDQTLPTLFAAMDYFSPALHAQGCAALASMLRDRRRSICGEEEEEGEERAEAASADAAHASTTTSRTSSSIGMKMWRLTAYSPCPFGSRGACACVLALLLEGLAQQEPVMLASALLVGQELAMHGHNKLRLVGAGSGEAGLLQRLAEVLALEEGSFPASSTVLVGLHHQAARLLLMVREAYPPELLPDFSARAEEGHVPVAVVRALVRFLHRQEASSGQDEEEEEDEEEDEEEGTDGEEEEEAMLVALAGVAAVCTESPEMTASFREAAMAHDIIAVRNALHGKGRLCCRVLQKLGLWEEEEEQQQEQQEGEGRRRCIYCANKK